jgi:hypothetical protein
MRRLITLVSVCSLAASGQSTFATLTGNAADPSGAAVPKVEVEARDVATNYVYKATTNEAGVYTIANLREGTYVLHAKASGFKEFVVEKIVLTALNTRRIDISLAVGDTVTTVEVTGGAALIETESSNIADVKDREVLRALPLTLRRAWDYFTLSPQINKTTAGFQVSFSGSRQNQGAANIDGTTIARSGGGFASGPLLDRTESFSELRMDIAGSPAEFGTIGQVTMISRAGTNQFHGTFSDYYSTPMFRARNPFAVARTPGIGHRFTYSAGGPVFIPKIYDGRNKTFVFGTLEMNGGSPNSATLNTTVPLEPWRSGNFANAGSVVRDPFANNAPFANNVLPASRINAAAKLIQDRYMALPNFGNTAVFAAQNYREVRTNIVAYQPTLTLRVDHRFSDKAFVYGRITKVDWTLDNWEALPTLKERFRRWRSLRAATIAYTHNVRTNLLNEFRWGTSFDNLPNRSRLDGKAIATELGVTGLAPNVPSLGVLPRVTFANLGLSNIEAIGDCVPCGRDLVQQFVDHVSWFRGGHNMKMGFQAFKGFTNEVRNGQGVYGDWQFSNRFTGFAYSDFLLGIPTTFRRDFPAIEPRRQNWTYAAFVQDDWKFTPKLTINLGLRYQVFPGWTEQNGRMALFDVKTGAIVVPDGSLNLVNPLMPRGYVDVVEASKAGYDAKTLLRSDKNNIAPRIGLAWRPMGNNTVVRAGYGIYFDAAPFGPSAGSTVPFNIAEPAFTNADQNPIRFPVAYPVASGGGPATVGLPNAFRPDLRVPFSMQYTLTMERRQWDTGFRLTYSGTNTRQGVYRWDVNSPVADGQLYVDKARRFPRYPGINYTDNGAGHQYHGLSFEAERRSFRGLHWQFYYTLAKDIQDLENGESPEYAYDRARERSTWGALPRHRVSGNVIYDLPMGRKGGRATKMILGGWQISSIYIYETGGAITPLWTGPDPTGTRFSANRTRPNVTIRPDRLADGRLSNPTVDRWFDVGAFAAPPVGRFGNSGKGVLYGTPVNVLHATIAKQFLYKERIKTRLELLSNNALNHPNYRDPNLVINQAGLAGVVTLYMDRNTKFDSAIPRELQAQLRVEW